MTETIFALSSGAPPAAIAVVRISGPQAGAAVEQLAGTLPEPRRAVLRHLRDGAGRPLDHALLLWFPGPRTATGEDLAEIHCHGGRAVVAAIEAALAEQPGLRRAQPGEFTRRAFARGRIDLAEAEGLADLLAAETELQRQAALASAEGGLSSEIERWRRDVLVFAAEVEAALDFADEDDVGGLSPRFGESVRVLAATLGAWLERPRAERLRNGLRVVLAGPPNAGKSSLFNALLDEGAAIVSAEAGTTRDVIERPVAFDGIPYVLIDTAGLRGEGAGEIEALGIGKARAQLDAADLVLWLGEEGQGPGGAIEIAAKADLGASPKGQAAIAVSAITGTGVAELIAELNRRAAVLLPKPGRVALNARQARMIGDARDALDAIDPQGDLLITGEQLRSARLAFDRLQGRHSTEDMLDALFGRFCIGK